jgi:hypothetical protein
LSKFVNLCRHELQYSDLRGNPLCVSHGLSLTVRPRRLRSSRWRRCWGPPRGGSWSSARSRRTARSCSHCTAQTHLEGMEMVNISPQTGCLGGSLRLGWRALTCCREGHIPAIRRPQRRICDSCRQQIPCGRHKRGLKLSRGGVKVTTHGHAPLATRPTYRRRRRCRAPPPSSRAPVYRRRASCPPPARRRCFPESPGRR